MTEDTGRLVVHHGFDMAARLPRVAGCILELWSAGRPDVIHMFMSELTRTKTFRLPPGEHDLWFTMSIWSDEVARTPVRTVEIVSDHDTEIKCVSETGVPINRNHYVVDFVMWPPVPRRSRMKRFFHPMVLDPPR